MSTVDEAIEMLRSMAGGARYHGDEEVAKRAERCAAAVEELQRQREDSTRAEKDELQQRVESLEGVLASFENWLEVTATYAVSKPKRGYAEFTLKTLRDDLSSSATKQEKGEK